MEEHEVISMGMDVNSDKTLIIETKANTALTLAKNLLVRTDQDRVKAGNLLKGIKSLCKEVKQDREEERLAARKLMDVITSGRNRHLRPLEQAEIVVKQRILAYDEEEERKRQEEENRINAKLQQEEEDRKITEAIEVEELGGVEEAKAILDSPSQTPPMIIPKTTPKIEGQHTLTLWKCKPVDMMVLIKAIAEGKAPIQFIQFNQVFANQEVKRLKEGFSYPGVEAFTEKSLASRSW